MCSINYHIGLYSQFHILYICLLNLCMFIAIYIYIYIYGFIHVGVNEKLENSLYCSLLKNDS